VSARARAEGGSDIGASEVTANQLIPVQRPVAAA
jgi:hypothetical protein